VNMMTSLLLTPAQLERANALLGAWLGDNVVCRLGEACRAIESADREEQFLSGKVTPRLISTLLRKRGFAMIGYSGCGYDREPVYRKPAQAGQ